MSYAICDAAEVEPVEGVLRPIRKTLGLAAFGLNQVELPPGLDSYPEHDEQASGQHEVYCCIAGTGTLTIDGEQVELRPGRYIHVTPDARRKPRAGPDGLTLIIIGAPAGRAYEPGTF